MVKRFRKPTNVVSVIFNKTKWTPSRAQKWLTEHGYLVPKSDTTSQHYRYRQVSPDKYKSNTVRTISLGKNTGIKALIAVKKEKNPTRKSKTKKSRIPSLLVDIADAISVDIENGDTMKFPLSGNWALCASRAGTELWILSRKGAKKVRVTDKKGEDLYELFTGFEHDDIGRMVQQSPKSLKRIGRAMNIVYRSDKFSRPRNTQKYIHAFSVYPIISVDQIKRPNIVALRGGRIKIKQEGIIG